MAATTFVTGTTVTAEWLNETDAIVHDIFSAATTAAEAVTALSLTIGTNTQAWDAQLDDLAALAVTDSNFIVGDGSNWVVETGATVRTSLGLGTGDTPQFTGIEVGAATDTTLTRASAGDLNIEGNIVYRAGGTDVPVSDGGTGAGTFTDAGVLLGNGTSAVQVTTAGTANEVLTSNGAGVDPTFQALPVQITLGTAAATTSGTAVDFTGIPAGTKRITIMFAGVSTDGVEEILVQIGDAGGIETSGYVAAAETGTTRLGSSAGFVITANQAATDALNGSVILTLENSSAFTWTETGTLRANATNVASSGGTKSLSAELTQIRLTSTGTPDDFDAGEFNISYE